MAVSDLILSPCKIYYSVAGTTCPADSVAVAGAWPAGWTAMGYTETPLSVEYTYDLLMAEIQEALAPVSADKIKETFKVETTLAELTLTNLNLAWNGTYTPTAATVSQVAKEELEMGGSHTMTIRQWGFEGDYISTAGASHPIRLFVWKAVADVGGKLEFGKSAKTGVPFKIQALEDLGKSSGGRLFKVQKVTGPVTT
jgi:hypothetical protein